MPIIKAQVAWERVSRLPEDRVVNTFSFGVAPGYNAAALAGIRDAVRAFYDAVQAATGAIKSKFSPELITGDGGANTATRTVRLYDLSLPVPRVPVLDETDNPVVGSGSTNGLPAEVAVCISFQAQKTSGLSQARRRGRLFIGPLNQTCIAAAAEARPHADVITIFRSAASSLAVASAASTAWTWGVHSEKFGSFAPVHDVWVDNAFDTQRRRGLRPTVKNTQLASAANAVVLGA